VERGEADALIFTVTPKDVLLGKPSALQDYQCESENTGDEFSSTENAHRCQAENKHDQ
jgi:hypothetical protein